MISKRLLLVFLFTLSSCVSVHRNFTYNESKICGESKNNLNAKLLFKNTETHAWTDFEKQELTEFMKRATCLNYENDVFTDVVLTLFLENQDPSPSLLEVASFIAGALTLFLVVPSYREKAELINLEINQTKNNRKNQYTSSVSYSSTMHILSLPVLLFKEVKYAIDVEKKLVNEVIAKARMDNFSL